MDSLFKIAGLIQHGRIFGYVKAILNVIFVGSIALVVLNRFYPSAQFPELNSLSAILQYFFKGYFIVPFGIYLLLWIVSDYIATGIFEFTNAWITEKWREIFIRIPMPHSNHSSEEGQNLVTSLQRTARIHWVIRIYQIIKKGLPIKDEKELQKRAELAKRNCTSDFMVLLRSMVALPFYFIHIEYFGWKLLIIFVIMQIWMCLLLLITFQFMVALPIIISKFEKEMDRQKKMNEIETV